MKTIDFNNPANYKNCSKKLYDIYVCIPPKNTIVINKLEQADVVKALGGKTYLTVEQIEKMQKSNPSMIAQLQQLVAQGRAYAVTDATPFVLCGTVGEMWTIKADKLVNNYNFLQGGQPLAINQQTLNQRLHGKYLDWTLIRTSPQATAGQNMACFVPNAQKGQIQTSWGAVLNINGVGVTHGKGDFVVCAKLPNGRPNLADRWVVNGEIFANTYNNQGWTDCLKSSGIRNITINMLPKLISDIDIVDFNKLDMFILDTINSEIKARGIYETFIINIKKSLDEYTIKFVHRLSGIEHNFIITKNICKVKLSYDGYVRLLISDKDDLHIKKVRPKVIQVFVDFMDKILKEENQKEKDLTINSIKEFLSTDFNFCRTQINGNADYGLFEETDLISSNNKVFVRTCRINVNYSKGGNLYDNDKEKYTTVYESVAVPISLFKENKEEFRRRILKSSGHSDVGGYGSREYFNRLSSDDKQKEIYDPNSPYYCGKVGV